MNIYPESNKAPNMQAPVMKMPVMGKMPSQCACEQYLNMPKCAHAYVPFQYLGCLYTPMQALDRATMFPELDRPYGLDPEYTVDA